jgi:alcohol dehydrogenase (cytochrome c)
MAVATKGAWLYLYDRATRELLAQPALSRHLNTDRELSAAPTHYCPGLLGGVEWNGPAYIPAAGLLVVNSVDWCGSATQGENHYVEGSAYFDGVYVPDPVSEAAGWTRAFDAVTGKPAWSRHSASPMAAGVTPTAGGVVFTGDLDGYFLALDARTGDTLYRFNTGGAMAGGVSTYSVDGRQYVAVASGNSSRSTWATRGAATVVVFALPRG